MQKKYSALLVLACIASGVMQDARAQSAKTQAPSSSAQPTTTSQVGRAVNIKALSKDLSIEDLRTIMHGYTKAIGAPCGYCHEENAQTKTLDFASDVNPMKETARLMIRMTNDINNRYLALLGDRRYAEPLTCGNCHQGHPSPPTFEPKP